MVLVGKVNKDIVILVNRHGMPAVGLCGDDGLLFRAADYTHRYPECWRCHEEIVFRVADEWFISMDDLRPKLIEAPL